MSEKNELNQETTDKINNTINDNAGDHAPDAQPDQPDSAEKKCVSCGTPLTEDQLFCPVCGTKNDSDNGNSSDRKKRKPINKKALIAVVISIFLVAASGVTTFFAIPKLSIKKIEKISADYLEEKSSYDEAISEISRYLTSKNEDIQGKATETDAFIKKLKKSRDKYELAVSKEKEKDYYYALKNYSEVIKEDPKYELAQKKIEEIKPVFKTQFLKDADEYLSKNSFDYALNTLNKVKEFCNDSDVSQKIINAEKKKEEYEAKQERQRIEQYKNEQKIEVVSASSFNDGYYIVNRKVRGILKNKSDKVVKDFTLVVLLFDSNGYPVNADYSTYCYNGVSNSIRCGGKSSNIMPGSTWGYNYSWDCADNATKVKACILSAEFYDGDTWTNPYFNYWITAEKDRY